MALRKRGDDTFLYGNEFYFYIYKAIIQQTICRAHDQYSEGTKPVDLKRKRTDCQQGQIVNMNKVCDMPLKYTDVSNGTETFHK